MIYYVECSSTYVTLSLRTNHLKELLRPDSIVTANSKLKGYYVPFPPHRLGLVSDIGDSVTSTEDTYS